MTQATTQAAGPETALITGGGTGIGRAAALALAGEGYEVIVAERTAATLEQTVKLVAHAGGNAKYVIGDVHDEAAVRHAVEVAAGGAGRLNVAVNSAGVDGGNDSLSLIDYPVETLELMLATNVRHVPVHEIRTGNHVEAGVGLDRQYLLRSKPYRCSGILRLRGVQARRDWTYQKRSSRLRRSRCPSQCRVSWLSQHAIDRRHDV